MPAPTITLVWFRDKDLRVHDHAPLAASARAGAVLCLFVRERERAALPAHRAQFLRGSLAALDDALTRRGSKLFVAEGDATSIVPTIARAIGAERVVAQRSTEPEHRSRDERVERALARDGARLELFDGETLAAPASLRNASGEPFSVYSAFARSFRAKIRVGAPGGAPRRLPPPPRRAPAAARAFERKRDDDGDGHDDPRLPAGGEVAARGRLTRFLRGAARSYHRDRDRLDRDGTSRLSVDLRFGTLSPRAVWTAAARALAKRHPEAWAVFSNELLWREFAYAVLWDDPKLLERPHRELFERFPWETSRAWWRAWRDGRTGYPVVDAAARQLLAEGFVHNRARMISASFLTKHLRIDFRRGEAHYLEHLVDGDPPQNDFGWQWTTGCGFDAAPYFRVFNPVEQGRKFDATGGYVRAWVPELARLPDAWIHEPWRAPAEALRAAGVRLGVTYPRPVVDHREARTRYLATMAELKSAR